MTDDTVENDIADAPKPLILTAEQKALERSVARAMWRLDISPQMSVEDKKANWAEGRVNHHVRARKLLRFLEMEKVAVSPIPAE